MRLRCCYWVFRCSITGNMDTHRRHVEEAIRAISIHSPAAYSWFGKPSARLPAKLRCALTPQEARNCLLYELTSRLYSDFYIRAGPTPRRLEADNFLQTGLTPFVAELSAANSGSGYWEDGWQVRTVGDSTAGVSRGDLLMWARLQDCMVAQGNPIGPDKAVHVRFPKEFLGMSPGFYMALGDMPLSVDVGQILVRVYWNLVADGAVSFVRIATRLLNGAGLPFRLKVLRDRALFSRCDAAVIYILKSDYQTAAEALSTVYADVGMHLKLGSPVFTKRLAPGVGLAEDPGVGESFGQNRCRLVADAVIRAYELGKKSVGERLQVVADRFAEDGISLTEPFLNPGSKDDCPSFFRVPSGKIKEISNTNCSLGVFLNTADELGWRLSKEAVWHGNQCNWLGIEPINEGSHEDGVGPLYKALGSTLYSGTSGVALFLAELYAASGSSEVRRTALGAIQQALSRPLKCHLGLYTGALGIVFAAARVGTILGEQELLEHASQLLHERRHERQTRSEFDLLSGGAGAIVAFLVLREMLHHRSLLDLAIRAGDELLGTADDSDAGYSWRSSKFDYGHNLTGFSHGTAGVGYALLELFHVTGDTRYRAAAERAFEYERSWFNPEKGNWPDFRGDRKQCKRRGHPLPFATFWCHGAPGIGLARLRAYEILNDVTCKDEAIVALRTTHEMIEMALYAGNENFSLCHGLAGNAEVLLYGHQVLGQEWTDKAELALEVAKAGIEHSKRQGGAWYCGVGKGETPSLLLGLAGIGYFYLRLHNPAIPSVLILRREDFSAGRQSQK